MNKKEPDQLAKDAAAASAARMSYGKWKAMQDGTVIIKPDTGLPKGFKHCPWCNTIFKPKANQVYCSVYCQKSAQRKRDRQKKQA